MLWLAIVCRMNEKLPLLQTESLSQSFIALMFKFTLELYASYRLHRIGETYSHHSDQLLKSFIICKANRDWIKVNVVQNVILKAFRMFFSIYDQEHDKNRDRDKTRQPCLLKAVETS